MTQIEKCQAIKKRGEFCNRLILLALQYVKPTYCNEICWRFDNAEMAM